MKQLFFSGLLILLGVTSAHSQVCNPVDYIGQNFDNIPDGQLPSCWSSIIRGDNVSEYAFVGVSDSFPFSGLNSAELYNDGSSSDSDIILVTPMLTNLDTHRLKFQIRGFLGTALEMGTLNGNGATAVFTHLQNVTVTNSFTEVIIDFSAYTGTNNYIGFRFDGPDPYNAIFLDNIQWEVLPECPDVSGIIVDQTTTDSATLEWESDGQANWQVVYGGIGTTNPNAVTPILAASNPTQIITGLEEHTSYNAWVRSVCTEGFGAWIGPITFTTQCFPIALFSESFENTSEPLLPECWSSIVRGFSNSNADVYVTNDDPFDGESNIEIYNNEAIGPAVDLILISPKLTTLNTATHRLKFFMKGNADVEVGTLNGNSVTSVFTSFQNIETNEDYTEVMVDFSFYDGTDTFMGIRMIATDNYSQVFIDNIRWEIAPPCDDVITIKVPSTTPTTADVSWISTNGEESFDVVYAVSTVSDPTTLTPIVPVPTETATTLTALSPDSSYNVWVRSICDAGAGAWIGPITFRTPCTAITAFNENFDGVSDPDLPICWSTILRGTTLDSYTSIETVPQPLNSSPNAIAFNSQGSDASNDIILVSPNLSNIGAGTHRLKFYARAQGVEGSLASFQVGSLDTNTNSGIFSLNQDVQLTATTAEYLIDFSDYSSTDNFIAIRMNAGIYNSAFIDDIRWEVIPVCEDASAITVTDATTESAVVHWTTDSGFGQIVYGPLSATDPTSLTPQAVTEDQFLISGLEGSTYYKVWVRSTCDAGVGAWIGPVVFTTECIPVASFDEGFDNSNDIPNCWTKILRGPTVTPYSSIAILGAAAHSAPNMIYFAPVFASYETDDLILVSPNLTNLAAGTHQLRFYAQNTGSFSIGTLNSAEITAIFTPFQEVTIVPGWNEYTVNFSTYTGTDTYIGFRVTSTANILTTVDLDDIVWEATLKTEDFNEATFSYHPNPVQGILNLSYSKNMSGVEVFNLLGQKVMQSTVNATSAKVNMSELPTGNYIVKVTSDKLTKSIKIIKK